jgi:hypothetical protein
MIEDGSLYLGDRALEFAKIETHFAPYTNRPNN